MVEFKVRLKPDEIEGFVKDLEKIPYDIDAICQNNRIVVDAKSILGMHAIYQNGMFKIMIHADKENEEIKKFKEAYNITE